MSPRLKNPVREKTVAIRSPAAISTKSPTKASSRRVEEDGFMSPVTCEKRAKGKRSIARRQQGNPRDEGVPPGTKSNSSARPRDFAGQHLQVVDLLAEFRFRDAVEKLAHTRMRTGLQLGGCAIGDDGSLVQQHHAVGDQKSTGKFMGYDDDRDPKRFFQFQQ